MHVSKGKAQFFTFCFKIIFIALTGKKINVVDFLGFLCREIDRYAIDIDK